MAKMTWTHEEGRSVCLNEDTKEQLTIEVGERTKVYGMLDGIRIYILEMEGEVNLDVLKHPIEPLVVSWGTFKTNFTQTPTAAMKKFHNALDFCKKCCSSLGMEVKAIDPPMFKLMWDNSKNLRGVCKVFGKMARTSNDMCARAITEHAMNSRYINYHRRGEINLSLDAIDKIMEENFGNVAITVKNQGREYNLYMHKLGKTMKFVNAEDVTYSMGGGLTDDFLADADEIYILA